MARQEQTAGTGRSLDIATAHRDKSAWEHGFEQIEYSPRQGKFPYFSKNQGLYIPIHSKRFATIELTIDWCCILKGKRPSKIYKLHQMMTSL